MNRTLKPITILGLALTLAVILPVPETAAGESTEASMKIEQIAAMCTENSEAMAARQATESLYDRLGGYDRIHALTKEIVRRHNENPDIDHFFSPDRGDALAKHVADFVSAGTGGTATYSGRDMPTTHAGLQLSEADFVSAADDIVGAMRAQGHGQDEIDEMVCILISLKDQVLHK